MQRFFLVGCGRSGTTLLQQVLNRHRQVAIPPETAFFSLPDLSRHGQLQHLRRIGTDLKIEPPSLPSRTLTVLEMRALYDQIVDRYLSRVQKPCVTHVGEKSPQHLRYIRRIHKLFPDSRVILLYRDGRDVAQSLRRLPWMSPDLYVNFALWLHYYRHQKRAERIAGLKLHCVKYEDFVSRPEEVIRKVVAFLELPYEAALETGSGNAEGIPDWEQPWKSRALEPISMNRVGLFRTMLTPDQVRCLERWGRTALQELGYELTDPNPGRLPLWFLPSVYTKVAHWVLTRRLYKDINKDTYATDSISLQ